MGLDMYAYAAARAGQNSEYWEQYEVPDEQKTVEQPREIAYWRKHPNLHGWMHHLWESKGRPGLDPRSSANPEEAMFNGIELELLWDDLDQLEEDIEAGQLPHTTGFFFGDPSDDYYRAQDLEFIKKARSELFCGLRVFYNSSW